jgi:hypothetical protein
MTSIHSAALPLVASLAALTLVAMGACDSGGESNVFSTSSAAGGQTGGTNAGGNSGSGGNLTVTSGTGGGNNSGCDKVDFVFIIDNSISMEDQQAALIASFPEFITTIQSTLTATSDYHIMVVDTDAETRCTAANCMSGNMGAQAQCIDAAGGYACNTTFEACDTTMGAGVLHPAGNGASNQECDVFGGNRYMVEGEPDLTGTFSCVAQVGLAGHPSERPMDALVAAMDPAINDAGGCNAGFLRDDAILVITFLSDDPNYEDAGVATDWYDAVVAVKDPEAVAVLGLTPAFDGCGPDNRPDKGAHWSEFIQLWGARGLEASICEPSYGAFFQQAVEIIDETCENFTEPS